jgi:hypothetical protein
LVIGIVPPTFERTTNLSSSLTAAAVLHNSEPVNRTTPRHRADQSLLLASSTRKGSVDRGTSRHESTATFSIAQVGFDKDLLA